MANPRCRVSLPGGGDFYCFLFLLIFYRIHIQTARIDGNLYGM